MNETIDTSWVTDERRALWLSLGETEMLLMLVCASPLTGGEAESDLFDRMGAFRHLFASASAEAPEMRAGVHPCDSVPVRRRQTKKTAGRRRVWGSGLLRLTPPPAAEAGAGVDPRLRKK